MRYRSSVAVGLLAVALGACGGSDDNASETPAEGGQGGTTNGGAGGKAGGGTGGKAGGSGQAGQGGAKAGSGGASGQAGQGGAKAGASGSGGAAGSGTGGASGSAGAAGKGGSGGAQGGSAGSSAGSGGSGVSGSAGSAGSQAAGSGGTDAAGGSGGTNSAGGSGGTDAAGGSGGTDAAGGSGGTDAAGGSGGTDAAGGSGGTATAGSGGTDAAGGSGGTDTAGGSGGTDAAGGSGGAAAGGSGGTDASGGSAGAAGGSGGVITPGDPGAHDVLFAIDATVSHPISPYIYGTNQPDWNGKAKYLTATRMGGNRMTAYNWETNDSNAGSDYLYENDDYISASNVAGEPMKQATQAAADASASMVMTVPIAGWVSADDNGPCPSNPSQAQIAQRFFPIVPKKGAPFAYPPDLTDKKVYADEFVAWLESQFPGAQTDPARRIFYQLDNEPDLWSSTHSEIHPAAVTYAELTKKNVDFASAIKAVAPGAMVFGPVNYGYAGFINLQSAPDAGGKNFIDAYLDAMSAADKSAGKRLVDVLDVHWYPEAQGDGHRIIDEGTSAGEVAARVQAPRSLWDPTYTEDSWITQCCSGPIQLIPWLKQKIDAHYPGTKLSFTEYNYGGGGHISGGVAEADVLGVFGREGLFAAMLWEMANDESFIYAGFAMFRNYDGQGGHFGDTSASSTTDDIAGTSVYGSFDAADHGHVVVVAINKTGQAKTAGITLTHDTLMTAGDVYQLTSAQASSVKKGSVTVKGQNAFSYVMPPMSVSTIVLKP